MGWIGLGLRGAVNGGIWIWTWMENSQVIVMMVSRRQLPRLILKMGERQFGFGSRVRLHRLSSLSIVFGC